MFWLEREGRFLDAFKARLETANIPPQLNRIGKMTYMLTDRRRKIPLAVETADLITALHCQYRRYLAMRALSPEEHDDFVRLVKTAVDELKAISTPPQVKVILTEVPRPEGPLQ